MQSFDRKSKKFCWFSDSLFKVDVRIQIFAAIRKFEWSLPWGYTNCSNQVSDKNAAVIKETLIKMCMLKLIICYIRSGPTKPSKGQQWVPPSWLVNYTGLVIQFCYYCFGLFVYLFIDFILILFYKLILTISAQMKTSAQFKFALYITND